MQVVANVVQLWGAVVTFLGLSHAYTRSAFGMGLVPWLLSKVHNTPAVNQSAVGSAVGNYGVGALLVDAYAPFALDTSKPIEDQLAQLTAYVRELRGMFPKIGQEFIRLDREIVDARKEAGILASQAKVDAIKHATGQLEEFKADQTGAEVLDLRIALLGLGISVIGTVLAFWA